MIKWNHFKNEWLNVGNISSLNDIFNSHVSSCNLKILIAIQMLK